MVHPYEGYVPYSSRRCGTEREREGVSNRLIEVGEEIAGRNMEGAGAGAGERVAVESLCYYNSG